MTKSIIEIERERHAVLTASEALSNSRITFGSALDEEDDESIAIVNDRVWVSNFMSPAELKEFAELADACHYFD
ncbi:MAG: hypothetical protein ACI4IM_08250 [Acutalibacteraceae bacterium]